MVSFTRQETTLQFKVQKTGVHICLCTTGVFAIYRLLTNTKRQKDRDRNKRRKLRYTERLEEICGCLQCLPLSDPIMHWVSVGEWATHARNNGHPGRGD